MNKLVKIVSVLAVLTGFSMTPLMADSSDFAGDVVTGQQKITDIYEKKGGALLFIVMEISLSNQLNELVCELQSTIVVRNA